MKKFDMLYKIAIHSSLICLVLTWMPVVSYAQQTEVPLYIKYRYEKQTGRKWYDASKQRQDEFITEQLERKRQVQQKEERAQSLRNFVEQQKIQKKAARDQRKEMLKAARERRKSEKKRIEDLRKQNLQRKRAEMSRRIQLRKN